MTNRQVIGITLAILWAVLVSVGWWYVLDAESVAIGWFLLNLLFLVPGTTFVAGLIIIIPVQIWQGLRDTTSDQKAYLIWGLILGVVLVIVLLAVFGRP